MRHISKVEAAVHAVSFLFLALSLHLLCSTLGSWIVSVIGPMEQFDNRPQFVKDVAQLTAQDYAADADQVWRLGDEIDRDGDPAIIKPNDYKVWVRHNLLDRKNGPAIEFSDGSKVWFQSGLLHRDEGPAIEMASGYNAWLQCGILHNEYGPAVIYPDGTKAYYLDGIECSYEEYLAATYPEVTTRSSESGCVIQYKKDDELHRLDGPALIDSEGVEAWYVHGKLHRENGPAITIGDHKEYWNNGTFLYEENGDASLFFFPDFPDLEDIPLT